jgi:hypothetical protein
MDAEASKAGADGLVRNLKTVATPEALKAWVERADPAMRLMHQPDYEFVLRAYDEKSAELKGA